MILRHKNKEQKTNELVHSPGKFATQTIETVLAPTHKPLHVLTTEAVILEDGVIIHDASAMTAYVNNSKVFHTHPDIPHIIHDKNIVDKNYKPPTTPTVIPDAVHDQVYAHEPQKMKLSETVQPNDVPDVLFSTFHDDCVAIAEGILVTKFDFESMTISTDFGSFLFIDGDEGYAPESLVSPLVFSTKTPKGLAYLSQKFIETCALNNIADSKALNILKQELLLAKNTEDWVVKIVELWLEVQKSDVK